MKLREGDIDPGVPPYPDPVTIDQTKANMAYYRKRAGYSQREASVALGMSQANYWCFEASVAGRERALILPYRMLRAFASLFGCPEHLIDPAQPVNRDGRRFKSIYIDGTLVHCVENPVSDDDYASNFRYFLGLSCMSLKELAERTGLSESSVGKWRNGCTRYRGNNIMRALKAMNCMEHRDLIVKPRRVVSGEPVRLKDGTVVNLRVPALNMADLKNNLAYHLNANGLAYKDIDLLLHYQPGTIKRWLDTSNNGFITVDDARVLSGMYCFSEADISITVLHAHNDRDRGCGCGGSQYGSGHGGAAYAGATNAGAAHPGSAHAEAASVLGQGGTAGLQPDSSINSIMNQPMSVFSGNNEHNARPADAKTGSIADFLKMTDSNASMGSMLACDDSMFNYDTGEGIPLGSLVLLELSSGDVTDYISRVVCVRLNDSEVAIRRLKRIRGVVSLCTDNPDIKENCIPMPEDAVIVGHVLGTVLRSF